MEFILGCIFMALVVHFNATHNPPDVEDEPEKPAIEEVVDG